MIGNRLKQIRDILNLTQTEFGAKLGFKWTKIRDLEAEKLNVSPEIAYQIEKIYFIDIRWLLFGEGDMFVSQKKSLEFPDSIKEPEVNYCNSSEIKEIVDILNDMPEEKRKECLALCKEKKLLLDLEKEINKLKAAN